MCGEDSAAACSRWHQLVVTRQLSGCSWTRMLISIHREDVTAVQSHWESLGWVENEGDNGWHANEDNQEWGHGMRDVYVACKPGQWGIGVWYEG